MNETTRGVYIAIEGGEHTGKTTQAKCLADYLGALQVREPGGTPIGENIRGLLLDPELEKQAITQVLLHAAQRAELAATVIRPELEAGIHVVSDRTWISSAAYQGAQGIGIEDIFAMNEFALGDLIRPDICFILDVDPEVAAKRVIGEKKDYYESLGSDFHHVLRSNFLDLSYRIGAVVIDATQEIAQVTSEIQLHVNEWMTQRV